MRPRKKRTEITVELEQMMIVKRREGAVCDWCPDCQRDVVMLTPDEAASLTPASTRALYRLIDVGRIHFIETQAGLIRLCFPSLLQALVDGNIIKEVSRVWK